MWTSGAQLHRVHTEHLAAQALQPGLIEQETPRVASLDLDAWRAWRSGHVPIANEAQNPHCEGTGDADDVDTVTAYTSSEGHL